eukprot:3591061-Alexandrium_andersonii.AAC.1
MSASLVGSEMCIRDSCIAGCKSNNSKWQTCPTSMTRTCAVGRIGTTRAVSYTHLTLPTICSV